MAIYLKNSMFIHIPKCGGRWIKSMIENHVNGYRYSGDPTYDAHDSPDANGKQVFCFIREPATFAHSLWHHRAKKKENKFGHKFNWQEYIRLEKQCQSEDYDQFMENVANNKNAVADYYKHYVGKYKNVQYGRMEFLASDFLNILTINNESFNEKAIRKSGNSIIGKGTSHSPVAADIRKRINQANVDFCKKFGYDTGIHKE